MKVFELPQFLRKSMRFMFGKKIKIKKFTFDTCSNIGDGGGCGGGGRRHKHVA